jgi:hypothetical protein
MDEVTTQVFLSFEKYAVSTDLLRRAGGFLRGQAGAASAGVGAGGALGGLVGLGAGGIKGYREAKDAGASTGEALTHGLGRGLSSAGRGALIGAAVGGAGGLAGGEKATELTKKVTGRGLVGAPSRLVQRQVHSLTGYADPAAVRAMGAGAAPALERAQRADQALAKAWEGSNSGALRGAVTERLQAAKGLQAAEKAEQMGLTSLPGYLKSLAKDPLGTVRAGAAEQWHGSGLKGKALMVGLPTAATAASMAAPTEPGGEGRLERGAKTLARSAAFATPLSMAGQIALERGAGTVGGVVGAGADKVLSRRKQVSGLLPPSKTEPNPADDAAPHVERYYSNAALGRPPEGMGT